MANVIPIIYLYIYRNLLIIQKNDNYLNSEKIFHSVNKVIYRAPRKVYREIIREMIEDYLLIRKIGDNKFVVNCDKELEKRLQRLNENAFPIQL